MDLTEIREKHPDLFKKPLSNLILVLEKYQLAIDDCNARFNNNRPSTKAHSAELSKNLKNQVIVQKVFDFRSQYEDPFKRSSICREDTSETSVPVFPTEPPTPFSPHLLPETPAPAKTNSSDEFISDSGQPAETTPQPELELPRLLGTEDTMQQPENIPFWKSLPKHLLPITGREDIETLENEIEQCAETAVRQNLTQDQYIDALTEVGTDSFLAFMKGEIRSILPIYATVQAITTKVNQAIIHRFDKPLHVNAADLQNPSMQNGESTLKFLMRLQTAGRRSQWPNDLQPKWL